MAILKITSSIQKILDRDNSLLKELLRETQKHINGINNFVDLYSPFAGTKILKAYLSKRKVRAIILLKTKEGVYLPVLIVKKDSEIGWNLSKYSEDIIACKIEKIGKELSEGKFKIYTI